MSQRVSGYNRRDRDIYQTPARVTDVLTPYLRAFDAEKIWEPAAGDGQMVTALRKRGFAVIGTDVRDGNDFFKCDQPSQPPERCLTLTVFTKSRNAALPGTAADAFGRQEAGTFDRPATGLDPAVLDAAARLVGEADALLVCQMTGCAPARIKFAGGRLLRCPRVSGELWWKSTLGVGNSRTSTVVGNGRGRHHRCGNHRLFCVATIQSGVRHIAPQHVRKAVCRL
jgi:hypothetical protein